MPMPGRQIVNGEPYRYGYQGDFAETDPETGKPAFQLRLWDARIGRWLTTDPYSQYHSPYLGMGNNPMNGVDPDGGCFKQDGSGEECDPTKGIATGYGGNDWIYNTDEGEWNLLSGQEYYIGKGAEYYQFSDALHQFRDNRNWNLQQAQEHFRKTGAMHEFNDHVWLLAGSNALNQIRNNTTTLYRGINNSAGDAYSNALKGVVKPRGGKYGHKDVVLHNTGKNGTLNSALTSWTTDVDVALNYAYRGASKDGVLLKLRVHNSRIIESVNLHKIKLIHNKSKGFVSESEKLIEGIVKGVNVTKVKL